MSYDNLQKARRRILGKSILSPRDESRLVSLTQQLERASGVVLFTDLSPDAQLREAKKLLRETP